MPKIPAASIAATPELAAPAIASADPARDDMLRCPASRTTPVAGAAGRAERADGKKREREAAGSGSSSFYCGVGGFGQSRAFG